MESVFELEKKILKAQSPKEIDEITRKMNTSQLRNVIKLLVNRMTPTNVKINRIQNSWNDDFIRKGNINMTNYSKFEGKIIRMNKPYPITNDEDEILGYTEVGDMAVITFAELKNKIGYRKLADISDELGIVIPFDTGKEEGYFETVIVSGKFIGVDSLALDLTDIKESTFIFNNKDDNGIVVINDREINYEYIW